MDQAFALELIELNNRFYAQNAESFSQTRQAPWPGWSRALEITESCLGARGGRGGDSDGGSSALKVFDLACGNLRFERFLADRYRNAPVFYAVDSCAKLAAGKREGAEHPLDVHFQQLDVLQLLMSEHSAERLPLDMPPADLSVCFGFMHHVPTHDLRAGVLQALLAQTRPGGIAVISLWRFADDARLAKKAEESTAQSQVHKPFAGYGRDKLEPGDYLLGWQDSSTFRYCHSFNDDEVTRLIDSAAPTAREVARFRADGRTGMLNSYVVLQKRSSD